MRALRVAHGMTHFDGLPQVSARFIWRALSQRQPQVLKRDGLAVSVADQVSETQCAGRMASRLVFTVLQQFHIGQIRLGRRESVQIADRLGGRQRFVVQTAGLGEGATLLVQQTFTLPQGVFLEEPL